MFCMWAHTADLTTCFYFKSIAQGVPGLRVLKIWHFPLTLIVAFTTGFYRAKFDYVMTSHTNLTLSAGKFPIKNSYVTSLLWASIIDDIFKVYRLQLSLRNMVN